MTEEPIPPYGTPGSQPRPEPGDPSGPVAPVARNEQHLMLLGGLRRTGGWSVPRRTTVVSVIGGVDLDLRDAILPPGEVELQHVSVIGGVSVIVPPSVGVRVSGLRLLGGRKLADETGPTTTTLVIRSFGILGGVRVRRG